MHVVEEIQTLARLGEPTNTMQQVTIVIQQVTMVMQQFTEALQANAN